VHKGLSIETLLVKAKSQFSSIRIGIVISSRNAIMGEIPEGAILRREMTKRPAAA